MNFKQGLHQNRDTHVDVFAFQLNTNTLSLLVLYIFSGWLYDLNGTFDLTLISHYTLPLVIPVVLAVEYLWSLRDLRGHKQ